MVNKKLAVTLGVAAALHAGGIFGPPAVKKGYKTVRDTVELVRDIYDWFEAMDRTAESRERLVTEANAQLRRGELRLGDFILKANAIDAEGEGNMAEARAKYNEYLGKLKEILAEGVSVQEAIPRVLKDLNYHGIPGGRMADALADGGGSCEQLSQLVAALVTDAGHGDQMYLRVYLDHVAPVFIENGKEYDLVAGGLSDKRGIILPASQLVESYAQAHGLASVDLSGVGETLGTIVNHGEGIPAGRPSGFVYPLTTDTSGGSVPLFSTRAIQPHNPNAQAEPEDAATEEDLEGSEENQGEYAIGEPCPLIEIGLNPFPSYLNTAPTGLIMTRLVDGSADESIDALMGCIQKDEKTLKNEMDTAEKALLLGHLSGLYYEAYWSLKLRGKHSLAEAAMNRRDQLIADSEALLETVNRNDFFRNIQRGDASNAELRPWHLAFLGPKAQELLFGFAGYEGAYDTFRREALRALLTNPDTSRRAMLEVQKLSKLDQAGIMVRTYFATMTFIDVYYDIQYDEEENEFHRAHTAYKNAADVVLEGVVNAGGVHLADVENAVHEEVVRNELDLEWETALVIEMSAMLVDLLDKNIQAQIADASLEDSEEVQKWESDLNGFLARTQMTGQARERVRGMVGKLSIIDEQINDILMRRTGWADFSYIENSVHKAALEWGLDVEWETGMVIEISAGSIDRKEWDLEQGGPRSLLLEDSEGAQRLKSGLIEFLSRAQMTEQDRERVRGLVERASRLSQQINEALQR